jgi:large conductance mechanosensitive channel
MFKPLCGDFIMSLISEFKEFAMKGNVVDLAVGVIIGGAFGKIVNSLVADVMMPAIGFFAGGVNFSDLHYVLKSPVSVPGVMELAPVTLKYGLFVQTVVDFLIVAFVIFMMIKVMNKVKREQEAPTSETPALTPDVVVLSEIRDILRSKQG